jgi:micrococcal nuclease
MKGSNTIIIFICGLFLISSLVFAGCSGFESQTDNGRDFDPDYTYEARVIRVVDGDTIAVQFRDGDEEKVRLLGVDCPETVVSANIPGEYRGIDDPSHLATWGENAREFTADALDETDISLVFDSRAGIRDQYGRLLAYVILEDGTDLGGLLISNGMARVYTEEEFSREADYLVLETTARIGEIGLWNYDGDHSGTIEPVPIDTPAKGVFIASVNYDAAGDDRENLNDEYLVIANAGPGTENLSGWTLSGPTQIPFVFGPLMLPPGGHLILHTGDGIPSGDDLFRNLTSPALGNNGGRLELADSEGSVVSSFSWGTAASG